MEEKKGIVIAGSLIADIFYQIDTYPNQGFLTNIRSTSLNIGGSGNMILDLAKMDNHLTIDVCAIVGSDVGGNHILSVLSQYPNIKTKNITVEGKSSTTLVMNADDTKQRTFFYIPEASDKFSEDYIDWEQIHGKIFHLEYLLLMQKMDSPDSQYGTHAARVLRKAQKKGMITSIDMVSEQSNRASEIVQHALKYTDICCINEVEAEAVTGITLTENGTVMMDRIPRAIHAIREMGVSQWIVIHWSQCSYGYDCQTDTFVCVPSLQLPDGYIKGTTGAGDAYCSGILYCAHEGTSLEEAMGFARASAVCSLSERNGTDGMGSAKEILLWGRRFPQLKISF